MEKKKGGGEGDVRKPLIRFQFKRGCAVEKHQKLRTKGMPLRIRGAGARRGGENKEETLRGKNGRTGREV